jgi:hypothetical protein
VRSSFLMGFRPSSMRSIARCRSQVLRYHTFDSLRCVGYQGSRTSRLSVATSCTFDSSQSSTHNSIDGNRYGGNKVKDKQPLIHLSDLGVGRRCIEICIPSKRSSLLFLAYQNTMQIASIPRTSAPAYLRLRTEHFVCRVPISCTSIREHNGYQEKQLIRRDQCRILVRRILRLCCI